jgi:hypothetical protein
MGQIYLRQSTPHLRQSTPGAYVKVHRIYVKVHRFTSKYTGGLRQSTPPEIGRSKRDFFGNSLPLDVAREDVIVHPAQERDAVAFALHLNLDAARFDEM